ncbi:LIM domain protein, partial [Oesophagostomum dentatum]
LTTRLEQPSRLFRCNDGFSLQDQIVNSSGQVWHSECFVCAQCFEPFPDGIYFEFEGRKYCEHDFHVLYAPCCGKCNEFIVGRVIKAMNASWHPDCFRCELCSKALADIGFLRNAGRFVAHLEHGCLTGINGCFRRSQR